MKLSYGYSSIDRDDTGLLYRSDFEGQLLWTEEEIDSAFSAAATAAVNEKEEEEAKEVVDDIAGELSSFMFELTLPTEQLTDPSLPPRLHSVDYKELLLNLCFDADEEKGWAKALSVIHGEPLWKRWVEDESLAVQFKNKLVLRDTT